MNPSYDSQGLLSGVRCKFSYNRSVTLTKWGEKIFVHINDYSKAFDEEGSFDRSKAKFISLNWTNALALHDCLEQLTPLAEQIRIQQASTILCFNFNEN